jgi:hypothetical protein
MASPISRESFTRDSLHPQNGHFILFALQSSGNNHAAAAGGKNTRPRRIVNPD